MGKTIGNPVSWAANSLGSAAGHIGQSVERIGGEEAVTPTVRTLSTDDIRQALRDGYADFQSVRTDVMFICLLYPIVGLLLILLTQSANQVHLAFPMIAGFALIGPFIAVGLYEVSRQREQGTSVSWLAAMDVIRSPNIAAIVVLGFYLIAIFVAWMVAAHLIWEATLGPPMPAQLSVFAADIVGTSAGWAMVVIGTLVGFFFALLVLVTSVISFPLLLDRNVGVPAAVVTSYRVFLKNPRVIATWGLIVAALLILGSIPAFIGLVIALPVLGHATWHLYRRAIGF